MPLFEYSCSRCEDTFELLIRGQEQPECPGCGSDDLEKLLSTAAARVSGGHLPVMGSACPPSDAPPCNPNCCRLP